MKIIEKIMKQQKERKVEDSITIVCLGDSVTEGCFECYINEAGNIATVYDRINSYSAKLQALLALLYPTVQINIINSGKSGGWACDGAAALERNVLAFHPDLVIVSYGLNDSYGKEKGIEKYKAALRTIFEKISATGAEIIFLTENYMCTKVSPYLHDQIMIDLAQEISDRQNTGILEMYFEAAKEVCRDYDVPVCDLYNMWKLMDRADVNVTELLSNKLNHPVREYHNYIAIKLLEMILA